MIDVSVYGACNCMHIQKYTHYASAHRTKTSNLIDWTNVFCGYMRTHLYWYGFTRTCMLHGTHTCVNAVNLNSTCPIALAPTTEIQPPTWNQLSINKLSSITSIICWIKRTFEQIANSQKIFYNHGCGEKKHTGAGMVLSVYRVFKHWKPNPLWSKCCCVCKRSGVISH